MLLNESFILANIYSGIINEDLQSSLNQTRNILKNNGVENADKILKDLQNIYDLVTFESDEHQSSRSDQDIPSLAFLILAGYNLNVISEIYNKYCNTKSLYSKSSIIQWSQNVKNTIQANKWFKPSEEKTKYIQDEAIKLIGLIHRYYVPIENKTEQSDYKGSSDDIVFNNDKLIIYRADNMDKCILYGEKNLCISYPKKDNYYWRYRLGKMRNDGQGMTTYFVNWKDSGKKILIDALGDDDGGSGEYSWNPISPNADSDISSEELIRKFRELEEPFDANVFQFVEYGENEKRAYEIDENIYSILDNTLNGYSDYDIFVQLDKDISNYEWENLKIDDPTKSILLKKYMGGGGLVSLDIIKKYGDLKDLNWYEDILSRDKGKSIKYYISTDGNVSNAAIKNIYNKEKIRVDELGVNVRKLFNGSIYLSNADLYFLPNLEDLVVEGDFNCSYNDIQSLKGSPRKVNGFFECSENRLQSLKGAPQKVSGGFFCRNNQLQSLEGAPQEVGRNFDCCYNQLQSLKGAPQKVGDDFDCNDNQLQSLEGAPQEVGGGFYCGNNQLQSLKGSPQKVGGGFACGNNQLQSLEGAPQKVGGGFACNDNQLQSLEGAPQEVGRNFDCCYNQLQSLKGAPQKVGDDFDCNDNQLQSLEGAPQEVGGNFECGNNQLQSLKGSPQKVGGNFNCSNNQLKSLEGKPEIISGFTFYEDNPINITESYDLNYFIDRLAEIHK